MRKILAILVVLSLFIVGCSKEDNSSYNNYLEEGKTEIANKEYEKGRNFFSLATEEKPGEEEAKNLYNQSNNLIEAINSKDEEKYDIAIQLCDVILKIDSESDIVRNVANDLKKKCEKLKSEAKKAEETKKSEEVDKAKETQNEISISQNIRTDYRQKAIEAEEVATKMNGIFRYQNILINTLRSYNINDLENAKVVYELSDELLNNLYQSYKVDLAEEYFNDIKEEQITWVQEKMNKEKSLSNNQLLKYQTLVSMTLDRCEELNMYGQF